MAKQPEYSYHQMLSENQQVISQYAKYIETLTTLPIGKKLLEEVEKIRQNRIKIQREFDINDPKKYHKLEDVSKYHPLALQYYEVQEQLRPYYKREFCQLTTNIQSLANKAQVFSRLMKAGVSGFGQKLESLFSGDNTLYEKTLYEIMVAGQYVSGGHDVKFIDTSTVKTADLLIDGSIEVECKKKDLLHPYYKIYENLWEVIMRNVPEWMNRNRLNYLIYVHIVEEIDSDALHLIKSKIHDIIYERKEGIFNFIHEKVSVRAKILLPFDLETGDPLTIENIPEVIRALPSIGEIDFMATPVSIYRTKEKIMQKNFKFIAMKIPHHPGRKIISNIKNASKQLTSSLPAIVYVDISALNQKMKIVDLDD
jgi:hypothetical protein